MRFFHNIGKSTKTNQSKIKKDPSDPYLDEKPQSLNTPSIFQSTPLQTFQAMRLSNKIHHVEDPTVLEPSSTSHQPQLSDQLTVKEGLYGLYLQAVHSR